MNVKDAARESSTRAGYNSDLVADAVGQAVYETAFIAGAKWQAEQSPWINVNKQLPTVGTVVLTKGAYGYLICFLSTFGEWETGVRVNEELLGITHWMPIPNIFKGR